MPKIQVGARHFMVVDSEDADLVESQRWHLLSDKNNSYAISWPGRMLAHRLIMGAVKGQIVDHIDHDGLNNSRANLRIATQSENRFNRKTQSIGSSGYRWAHKHNTGRWQSKVKFEGKIYWFGCHDTPEEAHRIAAEFVASKRLISGSGSANHSDRRFGQTSDPLPDSLTPSVEKGTLL